MHVIEQGAGTPLVLVHGFGVDHRMLLPLDDVAAAAGWRRLYPDLPWTPGTPVGDVASTDDVVDLVVDELRRRLGDEPFAVLGSSFGGLVARAVAHRLRPQVLGLATLAGVVVAEHARRHVPPPTVLHRDPAALAAAGEAAEDYAEMAVEQTVEGARLFARHAFPGLRDADQRALERIAEQYSPTVGPEEGSPEPFTAPSLFVTARQDHVVGYRDAWAGLDHYPRATYVTLDAAGHNLHLDRPTVVAALVQDWLARMAASRT